MFATKKVLQSEISNYLKREDTGQDVIRLETETTGRMHRIVGNAIQTGTRGTLRESELTRRGESRLERQRPSLTRSRQSEMQRTPRLETQTMLPKEKTSVLLRFAMPRIKALIKSQRSTRTTLSRRRLTAPSFSKLTQRSRLNSRRTKIS